MPFITIQSHPILFHVVAIGWQIMVLAAAQFAAVVVWRCIYFSSRGGFPKAEDGKNKGDPMVIWSFMVAIGALGAFCALFLFIEIYVYWFQG